MYETEQTAVYLTLSLRISINCYIHDTRKTYPRLVHDSPTTRPRRTWTKMYEYEPLDRERKQIRLLTLQPGSGDDKLFCTLATAYLDTPTSPYFETVSYVCGDSTVKATIMLHDSEVQIPTTSEAALRRMRRKNRLRTLWIDALCINQFDIEERGHQVGMMYEIYTQTSHNCIYLGLNDRNMQRISESMLAILREISIETRDYVDFETMLSEPLGHRTFSEQPFSIDIFQSGLLEFFQNPWFTRLWVVQEASLSCISTCYIGRHRLSLVAILRIGKWLCYKWHQISQRDSAPIGGIRHAGFIFDAADRTHGCCYRGQSNLWFFLYTFAEFHTFDRRDQSLRPGSFVADTHPNTGFTSDLATQLCPQCARSPYQRIQVRCARD